VVTADEVFGTDNTPCKWLAAEKRYDRVPNLSYR
jgi:hypothetical protein